MCDLVCDVITYRSLSCYMGNISANDKTSIKNLKMRENESLNIFFHLKLYLKDGSRWIL